MFVVWPLTQRLQIEQHPRTHRKKELYSFFTKKFLLLYEHPPVISLTVGGSYATYCLQVELGL